MVPIPREEWPAFNDSVTGKRTGVWCSRLFFATVTEQADHPGVRLMSINRIQRVLGRWRDGIGWSELMEVKRECGYGDAFAVECYPEEANIVNVANIRHLFILPERLPFAWRKP
jgi:hypothetical protein